MGSNPSNGAKGCRQICMKMLGGEFLMKRKQLKLMILPSHHSLFKKVTSFGRLRVLELPFGGIFLFIFGTGE